MIKIEELVKQAKKGDKKAFSELILYIKKDLYLIANTYLVNNDDVQDAVQNTIINAYISINKLNQEKFFKTWIIRILINECNRIYKGNKREIKILEKYSNYLENEGYTDETSDFKEIIRILNSNEQKIFELYYKYGFSVKEIAQKFNVQKSNIKNILFICQNKRPNLKIRQQKESYSVC